MRKLNKYTLFHIIRFELKYKYKKISLQNT